MFLSSVCFPLLVAVLLTSWPNHRRAFEDYVTWVDSSKIKEKVMKYNDALDDFDLLGN